MKSKNFSFSFAEDISKFTILGRDIRKTRDLYKVYGALLNIYKIKTGLKLV